MAPIGQFVQLLSALSEMQTRREQLTQNEREINLREKQFQEFVKQGHSKDVADALQQIMKLAPDAREAFVKMQTEFSPQEIAGFHAIVTGQPVDPSVLGAQAAQRGYGNASPEQQGFMNAQAASRATSGMDVGQAQASGAQAFQFGGQAPPGLIAAMSQGQPQGYAQQMQGQVARGAMQRMSTGQTPFQALVDASAAGQGLIPGFAQNQYGTVPTQYGQLTAPQAGQIDIGRGGVAGQFAAVNQRAQEAAANNGMEYLKLLASGKAAAGAFTTSQQVDMMQGIMKSLDDMQNPRATKDINRERIRLINSMAATLPPPLAQALTIENESDAKTKAPLWQQLYQRMFSGANAPSFAPGPMPQGGQQAPAPPAFMPSIPGFTPGVAPQLFQSPLQPFIR